MGVGTNIKTIVKRMFGGAELPGIEFYPLADGNTVDKDFEKYVEKCYTEADEEVRKFIPEWNANRRAYMGETYSYFNDWSEFYDKDGRPVSYSSDCLADKINDMIAIQYSTGLKPYPLPHVNEQSEIVQDIAARMPNKMVDFKKYARKLCSKVFDDIYDRRKVDIKFMMVQLDAFLCRRGVMKTYQAHDYELGMQHVFTYVVQPENYLLDVSATDQENARYLFEKQYLTPFFLTNKHPKYKEEILRCIIGKSVSNRQVNPIDDAVRKTKVGLVLIAEGYFKDETTITAINPKTGKEEETALYPHGRRVMYLPDLGIVLEVKGNPYKCFPYSTYEPRKVSWDQFGKNVANPIQGIQVIDDEVIQQMLANLKAVGSTIMAYRKDSIEDIDMVDNRILIKIPYLESASDISFVQARGIANDALLIHAALQGDSNRISGVEAVAEGRAAGSLQSGRALSILLEGTNRKFKITGKMFADFVSDWSKQVADIALYTTKEGMYLRVSDEDGLPFRMLFDLSEAINVIDTRVDSESKFPSDPTQLLAMLLQMVPVGIVDRKAVLDLMNFPGSSEIQSRMEIQEQQQREMQMQLAQMGKGASGSSGSNGTPGGGQQPFERSMKGLSPTGAPSIQ